MERIIPTVLTAVLRTVLTCVFLSAPVARAGLVLMTSPDRALSMEGDEGYPESRFGQSAARDRDSRESHEPNDAGEAGEADRRPAGISSGSSGARGGFIENSSPLVPSAAKGVQEVALIAGDLGFFPKTVFVVRDIPVRLFVTGASKNTLCIMMDSFQLRKQIRSQKIEEITFTPSTPGQYRFYCPVNGMEGTMVVKELSVSAR